jgi:molecular chaperone HscA
VTARDQRSGKTQSIEVTPSYGLADEDIERMLSESVEHAKADVSARLLIEARNEAEIVLKATAKALSEEDDELSDKERSRIEKAVERVDEAKAKEDHHRLRDEIEGLNEATKPLAERLMNEAVKAALRDRRISDIID